MTLSNTIYNTMRFAPEYAEEGRLMDGKSDLSILLTLHMAHLGGMNDHGLCYCMLQLPPLQKLEDYDPEGTMPHITLEDKKGDKLLPQLVNSSAVYNPAELTVLFNVHNDMSEAFTIDLKKDLL